MTPNYPHWDRQLYYSLQFAAQLCCDVEPENLEFPWPPNIYEMMFIIKQEVRYSELSWDPTTDKEAPRVYRREALKAWAERTGQRAAMPFLFPEDRKTTEPAPSAPKDPSLLSPREERWALEILAAVIEDKYGPGTVASLKQTRSDNAAVIIRDVQNHFPRRDEDSIRKYLKRLPDL